MTDKEISDKEIRELHAKINNGTATDEEKLKFDIEYEKDPAKVDKAVGGIDIHKFRNELMNTPEYKATQAEFLQSKEAAKLDAKVLSGLQTLLSGVDIATGASQVRSAERGLRGLRRPSLPNIPRPDELLNQQIYQAQDQTQGIGRTLAPYDAAVRDAYSVDMANARTASGGQMGAYGAYGQGAVNRRNRAALQGIPLGEEVRRGNLQRLDNLAGMRQNIDQQNFRNQLSLSQLGLNQYNLEAQTLGQLGAVGRQNISNSLGTLATGMAPFISQGLTKRQTFDKTISDGVNDLNTRAGVNLDPYGYYKEGNFGDGYSGRTLAPYKK